jgi:MoxR-like ATPase
LNLGPVLLWPITTRSSLKEGLYEYDAIARLQDAQLSEQLSNLGQLDDVQQAAADFKNIGQYIRLGPVGTAFIPSATPRVLLIDEIDKSDINLPNELLNLFEEGEFEIPELKRLSKAGAEAQAVESDDGIQVPINKGKVRCREFPIIIMTSNGERDFPPAFYRRCLRVRMPNPSEEALKAIVEAHLGEKNVQQFNHVIQTFVSDQDSEDSNSLPTDQLLNLIYLFAQQPTLASQDLDKSTLKKLLFNPLNNPGDSDA